MLYRRKLLLALLGAARGPLADADLQALLLLVCAEQAKAGDEPAYEFVPTRDGGRSFQAHADKGALMSYGQLRAANDWALADERMPTELRPQDALAIARVLEHANGLRGAALAVHAYREHPYYAIRWEARQGTLGAAELEAVEAATPRAAGRQLFTLGYEGRTLEGYLNLLVRAGVRVLVDVRRNALSRKFGFSKRQLAGAAEAAGIGYVHLPELGIASERRAGIESVEEREALFAEYRAVTLAANGAALDRIVALLNAHDRVALTCFERRVAECHRGCVAEALHGEGRLDASPTHI